MGFILTLVYIAVSLLSPKDMFPSLAEYRVELIVVLLAVFFSVPRLLDLKALSAPQVYLLLGLSAAVFLSVAIGVPWLGGGLIALQKFLSTSIVFYLILLNCRSIRHLKAIVLVLTLIAVYYVVQGARKYYAAQANINNVCSSNYDPHIPIGQLTKIQGELELCSPLLEIIPVSGDTFAFRMRGLGFFKDPNELAQFLAMLIPLLWIMQNQGQHLRNVLLVIVPALLVIWGMYLTHSRGGMVALIVILMFALKDRVNPIVAVLAVVLAFGLMTMLNFSGGRDISLQAGSNRFVLWGDGLALFKGAPVFGVGYENFANANKGQTAHNSFIVCLAELGFFGYAFWIALVVFTIVGLNSLVTSSSSEHGPPNVVLTHADTEKSARRRWAEGVRLSVIAFLAAAFFLSRAYALTLFLVLGMGVVLSLSAEKEKGVTKHPLWKRLGLSTGIGVATIALVYVMIRAGNAVVVDKVALF